MTASASTYIYYLMAVCFAATAVVLILNLPGIIELVKPSKALNLFLLVVLVAVGGWVRMYRVPHEFRVFHDEYDIYNAARMIEAHNDVRWCKAGTFEECEGIEPSVQFPGFQFLWAQVMKVSGSREPETGFYLNSVLGTASILAVYLLAMAVSGSSGAALFSSLLTAFMPLGLYLSGNATYETASFLAVCLLFTFVILFMRKKTALTTVAVLLLAMDVMLVRATNIVILPMVVLFFLYCRTLDRKGWMIAAAGLTAMAMLMSRHLPMLGYHQGLYSVFAERYSHGYLQVIVGNLKYLAGNDFLPPIFLLLGVIGLAAGRGKMGRGAWLPVYSLLVFIILNLLRVELWQGDFLRRMFTATIPLLVLGGLGASELVDRINSRGMKLFVVAVIIACVAAGTRGVFVPSNSIFHIQDMYIRKFLPETDPGCSIYSVEPSMILAHDRERRAYRLDRLYDEEFLEKHGECKILLVDYHLATNIADEIVSGAEETTPRYRPDELERLRRRFSFNPRHQILGIYGVFDFEIVYLEPLRQPQVTDDATTPR